jgi:hypothetical protein
MSGTADATITPVGGTDRCAEPGCEETDLLARVDPDADETAAQVLCPTHRVEYLREVSNA